MHAELTDKALRVPIQALRDTLVRSAQSRADAVDAVIDRHITVQQEKRKPIWIDFGDQWVLGRGLALEDEAPPTFDSGLLHPYRVLNAAFFLEELRGRGGHRGQS